MTALRGPNIDMHTPTPNRFTQFRIGVLLPIVWSFQSQGYSWSSLCNVRSMGTWYRIPDNRSEMKRSSSYFTQPWLQIYPIFSSLLICTCLLSLPTYLPESSHMWIALVSHSKSSERIEGLISTDTPPSRGATSFDAHEYVILSSLDQDMPISRFKIYRINHSTITCREPHETSRPIMRQ